MHLAARRRDIDMVRILVDYGANVNVQNGEGQTALHICTAEGDEALLKYFYGVRASASIADNLDRTPMHVAAGIFRASRINNFLYHGQPHAELVSYARAVVTTCTLMYHHLNNLEYRMQYADA